MGPPSYIRSDVDRNFDMRHISVSVPGDINLESKIRSLWDRKSVAV